MVALGNGQSASLPGATAATRYAGGTASGAPISGTFAVGDFVIDQTGEIWICTVAGSPGTWAEGATGAQFFAPSGLTGATAVSRYVGATASGAPGSGTFAVGDFVIDQTGKVWVCTAAGTPGTWADVATGTHASGLAITAAAAAGALLVITDSTSTPSAAPVQLIGNAAGDRSLDIHVTGDTFPRLQSDTAGSLKWGPGNGGADTVLARTGAGALAVSTGSLTVTTGNLTYGGHLVSTDAGTPAITNKGANVTSVTVTGNDTRGTMAILMGGALAANTRICTVTFAVSFGATAPKVLLIDETLGVGLANVNFYELAVSTGVSFDLAANQALAAGTYTCGYIAIG